MKQGTQRAFYCRCGREKILANGHCATCYTLRRQDERHFGGLRERVLERDGHTCRGCGASGRDKRSIVVHHRRPGRSRLDLMISLCPACHARIHRTQAVLSEMPDLLLELWRELHPRGHEQTALDFRWRAAEARPVPLFYGDQGRELGRPAVGYKLPHGSILGRMETKLQPCRICKELEASLHAAQQPDPPALVLGLTEAGRRNRDHQRQELVERIQNLREKHRRSCWEEGRE